MIRFIIKGLFRDRSRLLFPIITVTIGVFLTVSLHAWINGLMSDIIRTNADFSTGHVRILTKAYAENEDQLPNDLALVDVNEKLADLQKTYSDLSWVLRIHFGGLLDVPDTSGETRAQGPTIGLAVDLLSANSNKEKKRLNLVKALVRGQLPVTSGEILLSEEFAVRLGLGIGDQVTFLGATMNGGMAIENFVLAGTLRFGLPAMDRAAMIADLADAQTVLDMHDASGEILGYLPDDLYNDVQATATAQTFNSRYRESRNEFDPVMQTLRQQNGLAEYLNMAENVSEILVTIFIVAMSLVLWNAGLLGGLRRYGEIGVRLAIGEYNGHIYRSMLMESLVIGTTGSILGTAAGLALVYYVQVNGIDYGAILKNSSMMISTVIHTRVTTQTYYLGFIPGVLATILGTMLAGIGIYRRNTAQLFKEFEG
jgi:putative ABC transport system permease protein